ncbi:PP2C family protein-serine/threonine phosphatase [Nocardioides marmoribigeumensis]
MHHDQSARVGAMVAGLWLVAMTVVNLTFRSTFVPDPLVTLAPLAVCAVLPTRVTAAVALVTVAWSGWSGAYNDVWDTAQQWVRFSSVVLISGAAVLIAAVRIRREAEFERVSHIAEAAQRVILPVLPDSAAEVLVQARYRSASRDALVGGDLYDCSLTSGKVRFLIGDARGKGIGAVEQAARVIRAFRQSSGVQDDLGALAHDMDAYLQAFLDDEGFVTALLVDVTTPGRLTLASCGHPPPLLLRRDGTARLLDLPPGLPLGLGDSAVAVDFAWSPGDRLLLYTDGLSEARDDSGRFLAPIDLAPTVASHPLEDALDAVLDQARRHVPGRLLTDDLAVVLLENTGERRPARFGGRLVESAAGLAG